MSEQQEHSWKDAALVYLQPKILAIFFLGVASGLPLALTSGTLSVWLTETGVDLTTIGLFAAVGTPYALKFLWAPLVDSVRLPVLARMFGHRRAWMFLSQAVLMFCILGLGATHPAEAPFMTAMWAFAVAVASATQDIVIDAYRVEILEKDQYAAGSAMGVQGYRIGMLLSGAGALYLATYTDWTMTYTVMAFLVLIGTVTALVTGEPPVERERVTLPEGAAMAQRWLAWLKRAVVDPFADFMTRPGWWVLLLFVLMYKFGDAFIALMTNPFLLEVGFSKVQIATISKVGGLAATIVGAFVGGAMVVRYGLVRSLWVGGILQIATNLVYVAQYYAGNDVAVLWGCIISDNLSGGISGSVLVAFISTLCNVRFTATQYALLSSLAAVGRTLLTTGAGWVADHAAWDMFFLFAAFVGLPGVLLVKVVGRYVK